MKYNFKNLVFEGGGVKGIAYGGALEELQRLDLLKSIERVAGTSAGAIAATILALGYNAEEAKALIKSTPFKLFIDSSGFFRNALRFLNKFGWYKGDVFYNWISKIIKDKTGREELTFSELKSLYVIGVNLSRQVINIYSHETTPNMQIRDAVRISMSIPFFFASIKKEKEVFVDGGVLKTYPIDVFDNVKYLSNKENGEAFSYDQTPGFIFNHETLGFRLGSMSLDQFVERGWQLAPRKVKTIKDFALALIFILLDTVNKIHLHKNDWDRTVFIDTVGIKATDFNLSEVEINSLIESGRNGVKTHFGWRQEATDKPV